MPEKSGKEKWREEKKEQADIKTKCSVCQDDKSLKKVPRWYPWKQMNLELIGLGGTKLRLAEKETNN